MLPLLPFICHLLTFGATCVMCTNHTGLIETTQFRRDSVKSGSTLSCSVVCASDPQCTGYMTTAEHDCTKLTDGDMPDECTAAESSHVCYGKTTGDAATSPPTTMAESKSTELTTVVPETTPGPQGCVESARQSWGKVYLTYHGSDTMIKFPTVEECLQSDTSNAGFRSTTSYYADLLPGLTDMYKVTTDADISILTGFYDSGMVGTYEYKSASKSYAFVTGSMQTVQDEYGPLVAPHVDAADCYEGSLIVYLVSGNDFYTLSMDTKPPFASYTFRSQFTLLDPSNPFSALGGEVPQLIHALLVLTNEMVAFSGDSIHSLDRTTKIWTKYDSIYCA